MAQDLDPVTKILRMAPAPDAVRADAWDAFQSSQSAEELATRLQTLQLPNDVKAKLWDLKANTPRDTGPRTPGLATIGDQITSKSATSRFFSNAGEVLNPVTMAQGVYQAVRHPVDTAGAILAASADQGRKAKTAFNEGRYSEAAGHAGGAIPLIGPAAVEAGEQIATGDIAGGLGRGAALLATAVIPQAARVAGRAIKALPERVPASLESGAASRVADVISPKVGQNKVRLGNQADKVAPALATDLAADGAPLSRGGYHAQVQSKLTAAEQALDAASDARLAARTFETKPLIEALKQKRAALSAEAVEASDITPVMTEAGERTAQPLGTSVVPRPNAARVKMIDQAITELEQLGPVARYEPIRRIRQAYDEPAKAVYSPAVTPDYLKVKGTAHGAADVTGVLREQLARWDPATAKANAQYTLYRTANDVLKATAEVERTRPKVGRQIVARLTGSVIGAEAGGAAGAVAGYVAGPIVDSALASGATTQLKSAALMVKLATAIRKGDVGFVNSLSSQLRRLTITAGAAQNATSPSGSRSQTTAPGPLRP